MKKTMDRKTEVANMLRRKNGATVAQICEKTGMLPHSARALISGIRGSETVTTSKDGSKPTVYKIAGVDDKAA